MLGLDVPLSWEGGRCGANNGEQKPTKFQADVEVFDFIKSKGIDLMKVDDKGMEQIMSALQTGVCPAPGAAAGRAGPAEVSAAAPLGAGHRHEPAGGWHRRAWSR
jgi:hypothetical protein